MIEFGHLTHVGLRRELNEDTYYGDSELGLWLVADGMGGHEYGEVASALGNTPAVCRKAYIDPAVFAGWRDGRVQRAAAEGLPRRTPVGNRCAPVPEAGPPDIPLTCRSPHSSARPEDLRHGQVRCVRQ